MKEFRITIDKEEFNVRVEKVRHGIYRVELNGKSAVVSIEEVAEKIFAFERAEPILTERAEKVKMEPGSIYAMLPGTVVKIFVNEGDEVKAGDPILVLEAMKMENEITSPISGVIKKLKVRKGEKVETGDLLAIIG
ncbi:acetyl-CoA carboxylase biotin carboxyl carrier protein subunit [Archaeoglobales archaeon]|nr:MAG: acetyl-CoA carboxylase biotin carboxyl carrier protein subunit [Archaeoglobales archaeon]